jgi:hypothetical protein
MVRMRGWAAWHSRQGAIFVSHRIDLPFNSFLSGRVGGQQLRPVLSAVTLETGTNAAPTPTEASINDCAPGPEWISADVTSGGVNVMNSMTPNIYYCWKTFGTLR